MATLRDVAIEAGVSLSTSSRVIRGIGTVDAALASRVRAAAEVVGYRPDAVARNLRLGVTRVIALLVPDVTNPFFTAVARAVEDTASSAGYSVLLCNTDETPEKESAYLRVATQSRVAGVIIAPHGRGAIEHADIDSTPMVGVNRPLHATEGTVHLGDVLVDMEAGMRVVAEHLAAIGCADVAFVTGDEADDRTAAFEEACARVGVRASVALTDLSGAGARSATSVLLEQSSRPHGLVVGSAPMLLGALGAIRDADLRVGADIAVVGVDDAPWTTLATPPITVLAQPAAVVGQRAAERLIGHLTGVDRGTASTVLRPRLIVRDSTEWFRTRYGRLHAV